eukprot:scaffold1451_cov239-Chaetoceros_neogracile.AAC.2
MGRSSRITVLLCTVFALILCISQGTVYAQEGQVEKMKPIGVAGTANTASTHDQKVRIEYCTS